jgi:DNA-binding NarL/FixJ family response regulator
MRQTVVIVDDHADFREAATAMLDAEGFRVIGEAADGAGAIEAIARLRPEVVVLDIQLPDLDGFAVAERLAAVPDPPRVVLVSTREAVSYGSRLRAASACGFIWKRDLSGAALGALVG